MSERLNAARTKLQEALDLVDQELAPPAPTVFIYGETEQEFYEWPGITIPENGVVKVKVTVDHDEAGAGVTFGNANIRFRRAYWSGKPRGWHWTDGRSAPIREEADEVTLTFYLSSDKIETYIGDVPHSETMRDDFGVMELGFWHWNAGNKTFEVLVVEEMAAPAPPPAAEEEEELPPVYGPPPAVDLVPSGTVNSAVIDGCQVYFQQGVALKTTATGFPVVPPGTTVVLGFNERGIKNPGVTRTPSLSDGPFTLEAGDSLMVFRKVTDPDAPGIVGKTQRGLQHDGKYTDRAVYSDATVIVASNYMNHENLRPGYCNTFPPAFLESSINYVAIPVFPFPGGQLHLDVGEGESPAHVYARYLRRVHPHWAHLHLGREYHPLNNMADYHSRIYDIWADAILLAMCDLPGREELILAICQQGIDAYSCMLSSDAKVANGDYTFADRALYRAAVMFAGVALDHEGMRTQDYNDRTRNKTTFGPHYLGGTRALWRRNHERLPHFGINPALWSSEEVKDEQYRLDQSPGYPAILEMCRKLGVSWGRESFKQYTEQWLAQDVLVPSAVMDAFNRTGKQFIPPSRYSSGFVQNFIEGTNP